MSPIASLLVNLLFICCDREKRGPNAELDAFGECCCVFLTVCGIIHAC